MLIVLSWRESLLSDIVSFIIQTEEIQSCLLNTMSPPTPLVYCSNDPWQWIRRERGLRRETEVRCSERGVKSHRPHFGFLCQGAMFIAHIGGKQKSKEKVCEETTRENSQMPCLGYNNQCVLWQILLFSGSGSDSCP